MQKRESHISSISALKKIFTRRIPRLILMAKESPSPKLFKDALALYVRSFTVNAVSAEDMERQKAIGRLLLLIDYDQTEVDELSTGERLRIQTITAFWQFLRDKPPVHFSPDLFVDLYHQFRFIEKPTVVKFDHSLTKRYMSRWPTGLEEFVIRIREANKQRIIDLLVHKIERRHTPSSKYQFTEEQTYEEKFEQVMEWWNKSHFHLTMAIKGPGELNAFLGNTLSKETMRLLARARKKRMPFFVTPYYLSLLNTEGDNYDDAAIRSYILYSDELVTAYGDIKAWEKEDEVVANRPNAAGWLLPEGHNIHRRYPEVAILIPDSMGRACGGLCASCQRMYDFQSERLNFDFEALKPKETWEKKLRRLMTYFEEDAQLRDILITGGDAFMSQDATLRNILDSVYRMAVRKKKANEARPDGEKYAELQRVRLGSRLLAYLPLRITPALIEILRNFKERASAVGVRQFYIQTHFQSPLEVTPEAKRAIEAILSAGWTVTNQLVFTVAASRRGHAAKLRQALNSVGVVCYYTFSVKGFHENYNMFVPNSRSIQEAMEEKVFGVITEDKQAEFHAIFRCSHELAAQLTRFLKANKLLFAGTDRNVLNLPGIGKSMTFQTVGITPEGKRILRFEHDANRWHSPIIASMEQVYIVENKSIAAYLRQIKEMGENTSEYNTIWQCGEGKTEPRFSIYEYPAYSFEVTKKITNLQLDE